MTPKQEAFVREYLIDLNASAAYRRAGYKSGSADVCGPRLLGNAGVRQAIQSEMEKRAQRTQITADYVLKNLQEINERCMQRKPVMTFDREDKCMVQVTDEHGEGVWEFDAQGALRANELLGKHLKLFTEKQEISGPNGDPLQITTRRD